MTVSSTMKDNVQRITIHGGKLCIARTIFHGMLNYLDPFVHEAPIWQNQIVQEAELAYRGMMSMEEDFPIGF